jgi:hypothetical protein
LFPTSGADWEAGYTFTAFMAAAQAKSRAQCLVADGFRAPTFVPPPFSGNNTEFPDLPYLEKHGFLVTESAQAFPDATQGMSAAEASAYRVADQRCSMSASKNFQPLLAPGNALRQQWMNIVAQIDAGQEFQQALSGWRSCTLKAGIPASTIDDFFRSMDSRLIAASQGGGQSRAEDLHFAAIYAHCLGPAEEVRDRLRFQARLSFFDSHASTIEQLRTDADQIVADLVSKYGVKWGW